MDFIEEPENMNYAGNRGARTLRLRILNRALIMRNEYCCSRIGLELALQRSAVSLSSQAEV